MRTIIKKGFLVIAAAAVLLVGVRVALAVPVLIHSSTENLYDTGGTNVIFDFGGTDFSVGNVSGDILWQVKEKVFQDTGQNTTTFSYTVFNDIISDNITSFAVEGPANILSSTAPTNWTFNAALGVWAWAADTNADGIAQGTSLDVMTVVLPGLVNVGFGSTFIDICETGNCGDGRIILTEADWIVSSAPEPSSLFLLGFGLVGLGFLGWRKKL